MNTQLEMEQLYGYVFWYNPYTQIWYAIPTEKYTEFFAGNKGAQGVMSSDKIETLVTVIHNPKLVDY